MNSEDNSLQKLARPDLRHYAIAKRHVSESCWPLRYSGVIRDAWEKIEAGTHTLCTGRNGDVFILYLQPTMQARKSHQGLNA